VNSAAICLWGLRRATRRPETWILLLCAALVIPLCKALSPFLHLGIDTTWELADQWLLPMQVIGASVGVIFLGAQKHFLELLAPSTRWKGEFSMLYAGILLMSLPLAAGSMASQGQWTLPLEWLQRWSGGGLLSSLAGFWVLRLPAKSSTRLLILWLTLWVLPGLLA